MNSITTKDDIKSLGTILGIWAHPDDETYTMAGIMAAAINNGQKVICVTATRGEAGVQDESRWPANKLASIRTEEYKNAMKTLGVRTHHWLDYPDGGCSNVDVNDAVERISNLIQKYKPDSIFTFGPEGMTGHGDHMAVSEWAATARKKAGSKANIFHAIQTTEQYASMSEAHKELNIFFNIDKPPVEEECDCTVCYTLPPDSYNQKLSALRCMPSQTEAMLQKFNHVLPKAVGVEAFRLYN